MSRGNDSGLSPRSKLANKLLSLSEQARETRTRETLRQIERKVLSGPTGISNHPSYVQLENMLNDAAHILNHATASQCEAYLVKLSQQVSVWQTAHNERSTSKMSFFDIFSREKRARNAKNLLIEKLQNNIHHLEQRYQKLAADITVLEGQRDEQVQIATNHMPGSTLYKIAKDKHASLTAQVRAKTFEADAISKVLKTNQSYLDSLLSEQSISDLGQYMPTSIEKMEADLEQSNRRIEEEVEKLKMSIGILEDIDHDQAQIYQSLTEDSVDEFDKAVSTKREEEIVLNQFAESREDQSSNHTTDDNNADPQAVDASEEARS